jgi:hypothetical protein
MSDAKVALGRGDTFALKHGGHLFFGEGVAFDLEACLDGAHAQRASQHRARRSPQSALMTPDAPLDFRE